MGMEFYNLKSKKILYDGDEVGFYDFIMDVSVPGVNNKVLFENINATPIWDAEVALKEYIVNRVSGIKVISYENDPQPSYKYKNLDLYLYNSVVDEKEIMVVTATGECQPARYQIILLGAMLRR